MTTIGHFRILMPLGEGGMGTVYRAIHVPTQTHVALKVLHPHLCHHAEITRRFLNEARASAIIDDPGVVQIYEVGQLADQTAFIAMELLEGAALSARLQGGRLGVVGALPLIHQLARTLAVAHQRQVIHRDLKPANVMLVTDATIMGRERAKILDFGIAKLVADFSTDGGSATKSGVLMGTPTYMSPEQCRGARGVTGATDVYALGIMSYEMLAGRPPFVAAGHGDLIVQHITEQPRPLRTLNPLVPEELAQLVHGMLAKEPTERPSMTEVALVAERLLSRLDTIVAEVKTIPITLMPMSELSVPPAPGRTQGEQPLRLPRLLTQRLAVAGVLLGLVGFITSSAWFFVHRVGQEASELAVTPGPAASDSASTTIAAPLAELAPAAPASTPNEVPPELEPARPEAPTLPAKRRPDAARLAALGEVKFDEERWEDAMRLFQQAVKASPDTTRYRMLLASAYYRLGRYEQAISTCREILHRERSPTHLREAQRILDLAQHRLVSSQPGSR